MAAITLTDAEIAAMSPLQRRELISRLARPAAELVPSLSEVARLRRRRLTMMIAAAVALVPWSAYLGYTLPDRYVARNWSVTWVGFDLLLVTVFATTAVLGALRRQLLILGSFASGLLLACDAWFDVTTAGPHDIWQAVVSAVVLEVPIAVLLIHSSFRLVHLMAARLWLLEPGMRLWQVQIPLGDLFETAAR
jgi:hypothetical protein